MELRHRDLELECTAHPPPAGFLVCNGHDYLVSKPQPPDLRVVLTRTISIIIPWLCIREVPVDVELVGPAISRRQSTMSKCVKNSRHPKSPYFASDVECSRDSLVASVVRR